jgi:hypothetical protein
MAQPATVPATEMHLQLQEAQLSPQPAGARQDVVIVVQPDSAEADSAKLYPAQPPGQQIPLNAPPASSATSPAPAPVAPNAAAPAPASQP